MADNDLRLIIQTVIDTVQNEKSLNRQIKELSKRLDTLKLNLSIDQKAVRESAKSMETVFKQSAEKVSSITKGQLNNAFKGDMYKEVRSQLNNILVDVERKSGNIKNILISQDAKTGAITSATLKYADSVGKVVSEMYKLKVTTEQIEASNGKMQSRKRVDLEKVSVNATNNIGAQQNQYYKEAKKELGIIQGLKTKLLLQSDQESNLAKELQIQIKRHEQNYDEVLKRKIRINETEKVNALNSKQLNELEKTRLELIEKQSIAEAKYKDNLNKSPSTSARNLGQIVGSFTSFGGNVDGLREYVQSFGGVDAELTKVVPKIDKTHGSIQELHYRVKEGGKYWHNYTATMVEATGKTHLLDRGLSDVANRQLSMTQQLGIALQRIPLWMGAMTLFYAPLHAIQNGIKYIYDLDTAMTDLKKVTDETEASYSQFALEANKTASSIGGLTIDVIKSTTEWARLGYTMQQSKALARETLVYQNVGDIKSAEDASQSLISTIKGFGIEVDNEGKNVAKIVDIYNEVGNKFAISSAGIGEAMRRSAASLAEAGNTIEQSVALATAANSTIQDPARVGQMLKTVSMRLRGVSDEGEDLSDLIPTLEKKFRAIGLTLQKDDQTFKNTYDIFKDLSTVWGKLNDMQRADILESVAGKLQGNIAASLISNFKDAEGALTAGLNSFGSAARENEKYLESVQGKVNQFKNAVAEFWQESLDSNTLKLLIELATGVVKALDNVVNTVLLATGVFITFRYKAIADFITGAASTVGALVGIRTAANSTAIAMTGLQRAFGLFGLVLSVGTALYSLFNSVNDSVKESKELTDKYNESLSSIENQTESLKRLSEEYKTLKSSTDQSVQDKERLKQIEHELVETYKVSVTGIDAQGKAYSDSIEAIERRIEALQKEKAVQDEIFKNQTIGRNTSDRNILRGQLSDIEQNKVKLEELSKLQEIFNDRVSKGEKLNINDKDFDLIRKKLGFWDGVDFELDSSQLGIDSTVTEWVRRIGEAFSGAIGDTQQTIGTSISDLSSSTASILTVLTNEINNKINTSGMQISDSGRMFSYEVAKSLSMSDIPIEQSFEALDKVLNNLSSNGFDQLISKHKELQSQFSKNPTSDLSKQIEVSSSKIRNFINSTILLLPKLSEANQESITELANNFLTYNKFAEENQKVNDNLALTYDNVHEAIEKSDESTKNAMQSISSLASAYQTLQKGEQLSLETTLVLIDKYPQFAKYLNDHNGLIKDKGKLLETIANIQREEQLREKKRLLDSNEDLWKSLDGKRQMYQQFYTQMLGALPGDVFNAAANQIMSEEEKKQYDALKTENEQLRASIQALSKPIELKNFGSSSGGGGRSSTEKKPFESNLNIKREEEDVKAANRALEENQRQIDEQIAKGKPYNQLLDERITKYNKLTDALISLKNVQNSEQTDLKKKLNGLGLLDKQGRVIDNIDKKLEGMSKKEYTKAGKKNKLTYGYSMSQISEFVKRYIELPDSLADVNSKLDQQTQNIADTLIKGAEQISKASSDKIGKINFRISMLGEVNTSEEKTKLAAYNKQLLDTYIDERNKLQKKMNEANATLKNKKASNEMKDAAQIFISTQSKNLDDSKINVANQAEALGKQQADAVVFGFSKQIDDLRFNLSLLGNIDTDDEKAKAKKINDEINNVLLKEKEAVNKQVVELERKLTLKLTEEERFRVQAKLDALREYQRDVLKSLVDTAEEDKRIRSENASKIVETMKKAYQEIMKAEKEQHDKKIKNLDDEMKKVKDATDEKIKEIDREAAAEDYTENLKKKQQEAQDIQNKINELAVDDSVETKAKIADLEKQHADKIEEINKMQKDHTKDLRKQELQDSVDKKQKETDAEKKKLADQFDLNQKHWQNILDDEQYWLKVEKDLINGHTSEVISAMEGLKIKVASLAEFMGDSIQKNLTKNLQDGIDLMNKATGGTGNGSKPNTSFTPIGNGQYVPTSTNESDVIGYMYRNSQEWSKATTTSARKAELEKANQEYGKKIDAKYDSKSGTWTKGGLRLYHDGGEVGGTGRNFADWIHKKLNLKSDEVVSILKNGEFVLKNNPLTSFASSFKMPDFSSLMNKTANTSSSPSLSFEKLIHVEKIEKDVDIDNLMNQINSTFKSWGFIT